MCVQIEKNDTTIALRMSVEEIAGKNICSSNNVHHFECFAFVNIKKLKSLLANYPYDGL